MPPQPRSANHVTSACGQAAVLLVGGLAGLVIAAVIVGAVARAVGREAGAQRAADLAAVAAGRAMHESYGRLFEPALIRRQPNPQHLEKAEYLALGRARALEVARANGASRAEVSFPDEKTIAPVRVRVTVRETVREGHGRAAREAKIAATAEAELGPADITGFAEGGGYEGPLDFRQGKPMRPDVALAFDRMEASARADGVTLLINSGYRTDAEQAALFAQHPDPKMVARPGTSLHRYGTELDLGPPFAYAWLAAHAGAFHFIQRYSWEPWHFGYALNPQSRPVAKLAADGDGALRADGAGTAAGAARTDDEWTGDGAAGVSHGAVPGFVPARFAPILARAAQRWNVSATLLAAQIYAESTFNPFARSRAGALGIAQFMPATADAMGLEDPFEPEQAIGAQAHLMRDLLRRFGSVPLALAAYNAGPGAVSACGCIPAIPETRGYVARILGLMNGAGAPLVAGDGDALAVRLVQ
ncbi:transglycosylase SLT domain-containing protein [Candidatus Solirubrobacter pratensis]|uniref:transglycosylase SLT domain-containing protein n=1 Tax=Candidatus Solirubrobacter pratensis TaxID=1298857 RepID=UPI0006846F72|nr:transglycosylase SLT domain-containing protein [Candidatus Solirubrobacter pratensis]